MMEYFNVKRGKKYQDHAQKSEAPVLTDEDEAFLQRIASEGTPPPLPERPQDFAVAGETKGNDAQIALMNGAQNIPLPDVPDTPDGVMPAIESEHDSKAKGKAKEEKRPFSWSFLRRDSRDGKRKTTATDLHNIAEGLKAPDAQPNEDGIVTPHEAHTEEEEMTAVLDQLNLAAVNNRVFSISKESQDLLKKYAPNHNPLPQSSSNTHSPRFTLVLKDLVHGVPTAYGDLESLLTNSEQQLQKTYTHLPPFLQKLVEQLPSKFTSSIGPEMLAAAAEKQGVKSAHLKQATAAASAMGMKIKVPNLKDLVTKPGAVAGMLRAIMNFLKVRFPAFMGMNVLWSLALFGKLHLSYTHSPPFSFPSLYYLCHHHQLIPFSLISTVLLFVFWYCHKRGREVRLEKERLLTEAEIAALDHDTSDPTQSPPTTTAPEGAPIEQVQEGMFRAAAQEGLREGEEAKYAEDGSLAKELRRKKVGSGEDVAQEGGSG